MKKILFATLLVITFSYSQTPCVNGFAGEYPCDNLDLMSFIPVSTFDSGAGNDSWGWTDPVTGREYALYCDRSNVAFVDITDPVNPIYVGKLNRTPGTNPSTWRDVKVYNDHAFIVSEAGGHGMQVFDMTQLKDVTNPPVVFTQDAHNNSFGSAHNIVINEDSGYAYIVGANSFNGGPIFINIQDPTNPVNEGGYSADGYTHDAQVINYNGPDAAHVGKELYIGANEDSIVIIDVTDKASPVKLSEMFYSNTAYTHQVWIDEDHRYLYCNDEIDELNFGFNTRNIVFDLNDIDNPVLKMEYFGSTPSTDHNNYIVGDKLYIANYKSGLKIVDISDIANNNMTEIASFDTYPSDDNAGTEGAWSVYPYFASGNIVISDINRGLFVVRDSNDPLTVPDNEVVLTAIYPNPAGDFLHVESNQANITKIEVLDILGKQVIVSDNLGSINRHTLDVSSLKTGFYFIKLNNSTTRKFLKK